MSDRFSMLLWEFDKNGVCCSYYLAPGDCDLGNFYECYPWEPIDNSFWRTDKEGEVTGYYVVEQVSILGTKAMIDCSNYDGSAHRCEKKRWRKKGCCCLGYDRNEEKIPGTCNR